MDVDCEGNILGLEVLSFEGYAAELAVDRERRQRERQPLARRCSDALQRFFVIYGVD